MIKTGFKYKALSPKKTKTGKTMFSLSDYDKSNPNAKRYCTVFCTNDIEVQDREEIVIEKIESISLGIYKEKLQVSMFAEVRLDAAEVDKHLEKMSGSVKLDIDSDQLPF